MQSLLLSLWNAITHTQLLGTPTESSSSSIWPGVTRLPYWQADVFPTWPKLSLKHALLPSSMSTAGLNLLQQLLTYDPAKRITAKQALQHQYCTSETATTAVQSFAVGTTEKSTVNSKGKCCTCVVLIILVVAAVDGVAASAMYITMLVNTVYTAVLKS
jgi:serine/threonine protein kinase